MDDKFLKPYNPKETEERIYKLWEESGFFNPDICIERGVTDKDAESFSLIMPPPNANGRLHAGHALVIALGDITTRFNRMRGKKSLWVPGADHAGFETQIVYEKKLEKEGRSRFEMDPKDLYKEIYDFTIENKKHMEDDVRRLGASCDWEKEKFTLDPKIVKTVQETFDKMFKDGLIYRGERIVNWCSRHQTSLSEVETEFKEKKEPFYYFKYGPFIIGTSRPETKFGDKFVVMHPEDVRYANYKHGDKLTVEWINGPIEATIIKDSSVDMEFGTGVMTITPWHDSVDFEIAEKHNLPKEQVIDFKGKLLPIGGEFEGLHISKARTLIVEKLKSKGLLEKIDEDYVHNIKVCYKCETTIEPQIKDQWFVKMRPLADKALEAVNAGKIEFIPQNFEKVFKFWMENTIDWNISRQIIWGIPIPAKICDKCKIGFSDLEDKITECKECKGNLRKDTDTFDTWFSSGQWTLLALGYPEEKYLKEYHPTTVMQTGRDLIFKWIPRMVIFSLYLRNEIPFEKVYLNGMVNDAKGQKMSKSKGNVVSPVEIADEFGADALRMGLVVSNAPGGDLSLVKDKIKGYKHFANKIWNITRFVIENTKNEKLDKNFDSFTNKDLDLKKEQEELIKEITKEIEGYMFHTASEKIYSYTWHRFADQILEESKIIFEKGTEKEKKSRKQFLLNTLEKILIILHPFMPFITEEIWQTLGKEKMLMVEKWPKV